MLKEIRFDLPTAITKSKAVQDLLQTLKPANINYSFTPLSAPANSTATPCEALQHTSAHSSENCLIITDCYAGIRAAHSAGIPCIGYAPPGNSETMSGAYAVFEDFASIDVAYLCRTHAHAVGYPADILTTERLIVREFSEEDFPMLYTMCTEPSTASFMEETLSDYETELEKHTAYLRSVYPFFDLALWGIFEKASGKLIGRAGFSLPEDGTDTFSLGYLIDIPYRSRGYAKECIPALLAFAKEQGYTTISAYIKKENIASVKVLEQCGFPYERKEETEKGKITYFIHLTI